MEYEIELSEDHAFVKYSGVLELSVVEDCNVKFCGNKSFKYMKYQISDFLDVTGFDGKVEDVRRLVTLDRSSMFWNENLKIACVVKNEDVKQLVEAYIKGISGTGWVCRMFEIVEDAKSWCLESI